MKVKRWILQADIWPRGDTVSLVEAVVPRIGPRERDDRYFLSDELTTPAGLRIRIEIDYGGSRDGIYVWSGKTCLMHVYPVGDSSFVSLMLPTDELLKITIFTPVGG